MTRAVSMRAYLQALALYPLSPEANTRIVDRIYQPQNRFDEARDLLNGWLEKDPDNPVIQAYLHNNEAYRKIWTEDGSPLLLIPGGGTS